MPSMPIWPPPTRVNYIGNQRRAKALRWFLRGLLTHPGTSAKLQIKLGVAFAAALPGTPGCQGVDNRDGVWLLPGVVPKTSAEALSSKGADNREGACPMSTVFPLTSAEAQDRDFCSSRSQLRREHSLWAWQESWNSVIPPLWWPLLPTLILRKQPETSSLGFRLFLPMCLSDK